jgi:Tfp pilus assembly protein PilN
MTTINLLPPEIREKRVAERRRILVGMGAAVLLGAIGAVIFLMNVMLQGEQAKLSAMEKQSAGIQRAITEYQIFEKQKQDVDAKKAVVDQVTAGEVPWYKLFNEVALVIPSDVWLTAISGDEKKGVSFIGAAVDQVADTPDSGHKPVAKWLVRLSEIPMLTDVWLTSSAKGVGTVLFSTTAKVTAPNSPAAAPAPPGAPTSPSTSGGGG